jgi:hypothetical protein
MSVKKYKKAKGYESLNREFLQRNDLSLEARGLLAYMESMPDNYIFHKTNLYKCFAKNKKTSVERIWNELLDNHFIIAFSKGKAPRQEFEYLFTHEGFSEEETEKINADYLSENWEIAYRSGTNRKPAAYYQKRAKMNQKVEDETSPESNEHQGVENQHPDNHGIPVGVDFEQHNLNSSKSTGNKFITKGFTVNDDDDEKNNKEISESQIESTQQVENFCNRELSLHESLKTISQNNLNIIKTGLENFYWEIGEKQTKQFFKLALDYTLEHLVDMSHFGTYLVQNMEFQAQRAAISTDVKQVEEAQHINFHVPMDGPWNASAN